MTDSDVDSTPFEVKDKRRFGFYIADNELVDIAGPTIGVYGIAVYNVYARHANREGEAEPSHKTVAKKCACSKRKVADVAQHLAQLRMIEITPRFKQNPKTGKLEPDTNLVKLLDKSEWSEALWSEGVNPFTIRSIAGGAIPPIAQDSTPPMHEVREGIAQGAIKQDSINKTHTTTDDAGAKNQEPHGDSKHELLDTTMRLFELHFCKKDARGNALVSEPLKGDLIKTIDTHGLQAVHDMIIKITVDRASADKPITWGYIKGALAKENEHGSNTNRPTNARIAASSRGGKTEQGQAGGSTKGQISPKRRRIADRQAQLLQPLPQTD